MGSSSPLNAPINVNFAGWRGGGGGVQARGGGLMPETIPHVGLLTDRSLVSIQKRLPSQSLEAF